MNTEERRARVIAWLEGTLLKETVLQRTGTDHPIQPAGRVRVFMGGSRRWWRLTTACSRRRAA